MTRLCWPKYAEHGDGEQQRREQRQQRVVGQRGCALRHRRPSEKRSNARLKSPNSMAGPGRSARHRGSWPLGQQRRGRRARDWATSTTRAGRARRASGRAAARSAWRSATPWRSIRIPFARSITPRRSSALSSWSTFSCSRRGLAVAAHRDLDRPLDRLGVHRLDVGGDAPVGGARQEVDVGVRQLGDHRPGGVLDRLADQRERVLVVLVDDDDRDLRILLARSARRRRGRTPRRASPRGPARRAPRAARAARTRSRPRSGCGGCVSFRLPVADVIVGTTLVRAAAQRPVAAIRAP